MIGGRRVGKTSVLSQLCSQLAQSGDYHAIYHDVESIANIDELLQEEINWSEYEQERKNLPSTFRELFQTPPKDKPLVIFLDEADKLVLADRDLENKPWAIFKTLRAFSSNKQGLFIFGGEFTLQEALHDSSSPAYNFADIMLLGPLDFGAVQQLVRGPMKQLGIILKGEEQILNAIYEFTSGHPNIVQKLCVRLISRMNKNKTRVIELSDVKSIIEDPNFQENDYLETLWDQASLLEKIISLLLTRDNKSLNLSQVFNKLKAEKIQAPPSEIQSALTSLVDLRLILKHSNAGYSFTTKAFPDILRNSHLVEDKLFILCDEYRKHGMFSS